MPKKGQPDDGRLVKAREALAKKKYVQREATAMALRAAQKQAALVLVDGMDADKVGLDRAGHPVLLGPDHAERRQNAIAILDRTGFGPSSSIDVNVDASIHLMGVIQKLDEVIEGEALELDP